MRNAFATVCSSFDDAAVFTEPRLTWREVDKPQSGGLIAVASIVIFGRLYKSLLSNRRATLQTLGRHFQDVIRDPWL
jgi:hypothetical protein